MKLGLILAVALAASLPGCKGQPSGSGAVQVVHPESGLVVIPLTITHAGLQHGFKVELAKSAKEQEAGLMFRTKLGADEGMLFPMEPPRSVCVTARLEVIL